MLSIWTDIGDAITDFANSVKDFFVDNSRNPFLWVGIIIVGLFIFEMVFKTLNKND